MNISRVHHPSHFTDNLQNLDLEVYDAIHGELRRQKGLIELIASEQVVSSATLEALGSVMINKTVVGNLIADVIDGLNSDSLDNSIIEKVARNEVKDLCSNFPIYPSLG